MWCLYAMKDIGGHPDVKIGITSHPGRRLGQYQNSYSHRSFTAKFDSLWIGYPDAVKYLEADIKQKYKMDIELGGQGHSEWIINHTIDDIINSVAEFIDQKKYKVYLLPKNLLPITRYNLNNAIDWAENNLFN